LAATSAHGIGTKKDTSSWFKNILHRAMYLKGITTTTRTIRCTSCGRSHEDWNHFWKCPKYKPIWKKLINLMNETTIAEESGKTHDYTQEWVYLGIRKDGKALNRGHALMHIAHANMEIHYKRKSTHESIDRRKTAEKHKHRHTMEANNEQTDHKNTCNTTQTQSQDGKSENNNKKRISEARRILTLQYE